MADLRLAPFTIKNKKREGISFEKSLLSAATGEHCLLRGIYYTNMYIRIAKLILYRGFWIAALEKRETGDFRWTRQGVWLRRIFFFSFLQPLQFLPRWTRNSFYAIRWYVTRKFCVWRRSSVVSVVVESLPLSFAGRSSRKSNRPRGNQERILESCLKKRRRKKEEENELVSPMQRFIFLEDFIIE